LALSFTSKVPLPEGEVIALSPLDIVEALAILTSLIGLIMGIVSIILQLTKAVFISENPGISAPFPLSSSTIVWLGYIGLFLFAFGGVIALIRSRKKHQ